VNGARGCAFVVVRRVFEQGAYADRAFAAEARDLVPRERALAQAIAYGTVQRRLTLDHLAEELTGRPLRKLEPAVRAALGIGLFQLLYLGGVPQHAAVAETVELVKPVSPRGAGLVNAVLRRAAGQGQALLKPLHDRDPGSAALFHSVPPWLTEMWFAELGPKAARALLARVNQPAESALRVNTLSSSVEEVVGALPVSAQPAPGLPEGLVLEAPFDAHGSALWRRGAIMPQSRGSMLVGRRVDPQPGERVLDLCAAPGGKTTHLAALAAGEAEIVAVERHPGRARALEGTCRRMHAGRVRVVVGDAATWEAGQQFDRVLVDPPCSGLGTLQSRPDLRWRMTREAIGELAERQLALLRAAARATRAGGSLTYSVCTISRRESHDVIEALRAEQPGFGLEESLQLLPHRDGTDGFFIARLRREAD
jgi:16S rRNA (cytosine967-C5)-methyltransferase